MMLQCRAAALLRQASCSSHASAFSTSGLAQSLFGDVPVAAKASVIQLRILTLLLVNVTSVSAVKSVSLLTRYSPSLGLADFIAASSWTSLKPDCMSSAGSHSGHH